MASGRFTPLPLVVRRLEVRRVGDRTPRMRRVTLGGPELGAFTRDGLELPAFASQAFDDHVKIVLAPDGDIADALPQQRENGIEWPDSAIRVTRDYTPVDVDLDAGEVSFDFVVHTADGEPGRGPAEAWAAAARPGDELWIVGPKSSTLVPEDAQWTLLIGDETGLPAIERFLTDRPVDGPVTVVVAVADESALPDLSLGPKDALTCVVAEPGAPKALIEAVQRLERPGGAGYVWAGAESRALLPVRRLLTREWKIAKSHLNITGYWHRVDGPAAANADRPARPAAGQLLPVLPGVVHSPVSWFAVRIALRTGLLQRCEAGAGTLAELSAALGIAAVRLDPLVKLLVAADVLSADGDRISVGPGGELILGDEHVAELFDGAWADQVMLLTDLEEALPAAEPNWRRRRGDSYFAQMTADPEEYGELMEGAGRLTFLIPALKTVPALAGTDPLVAVGPGAAVLAAAFAADGRAVRIVEQPQVLEVLAAAGEPGVATTAAGDESGLVVGGLALDARDDDEAHDYLTRLRATASALVLVEATGTDALGPGAAEQAFLRVAVAGARPRTRADIEALAAAAGWRLEDAVPLGWGVEALTLVSADSR
ncbi:siderophore-interacting protein [Gordonia caeni]|uniref:FAD-binding FR-type domain-containing protein n=1 Tax=Gordonia caeni TaxID=1007097 RepID=A0ABP7NYA8_9ACTN